MSNNSLSYLSRSIRVRVLIAAFAFFICMFAGINVRAQTTEFTYQGRLLDSSLPLPANYDFEFSLWDSLVAGTQQGTTQTVTGVAVANGIFTVRMDFGQQFPSDKRFLQIAVRPAGGGAYTTLAPRQPITSSPYSIKSASSTSADGLSAVCNLCVTDAHILSIDGAKVTGTVANATNATTAGNVTGVVAVANGGTGSSTQNFVDLSTTQASIGGNKTFTGAVGVIGGSGVFNGNGSGLTNLNGANITNNTINASALASDTFPNNQNLARLGQLRWDLLGQRVAVGLTPQAVAFDGANIWVVNRDSNNVTKLRSSDGALQGTFAVGSFPIGVAFDGANIWVANGNSNDVTKLRASDGALQGTFAVGVSPHGVAFDGANIWVTNQGSANVTKLRASDGACAGVIGPPTPACTFAVGSTPAAAAFDGANIWVANYSSANVTKLRASDGAPQGTFAVGSTPQFVAFDGANIWVANQGSANVTKLRASDGALQGTFAVGTFPHGVAFDGANIWVANMTSNNVTKLRASDGTLLGTFAAGTFPAGAAFDGANIWVANGVSNNVVKLPVFP
jgi:hypothetical protein